MRDAQREFFDKTRRRPDTITRAKDLERQVDRACRELLASERTGTLFD